MAFLLFRVAHAEPTVDVVNGGAWSGGVIVAARFGATVDFEEPLLDPVHEVRIVPTPIGDAYWLHRRVREVRFSYPEGGEVDTALAALVQAWNATGAPGTPYVVERYREVRRLIPTTATQPDGTRRPWTSPLACRISLPPYQGHPEDRAAEVLRAVARTCGGPPVELADPQISAWTERADASPLVDRTPPGPGLSTEELLAYELAPADRTGEWPFWTFPDFAGTARDALDDLSRITGGGGYYLLQAPMVHPDVAENYLLGFHPVDPKRDDEGLNRTPLVGPAKPDRQPPPFPDPPVSWAIYRAWWNAAHPDQPATATFGEDP